EKKRKAWSDSTQQRAQCEECNTSHKESLSPNHSGDPPADRQDNGVGNQVRGENPGALIVTDTEVPRHVGKSHVRDTGVEILHERRDRYDARDEPWITGAAHLDTPWARHSHPGGVADRCSLPAR